MLLVLRSTTYIGVFVEFVAAVAWIAELFDDPKQREARARLHAGVFVDRRADGHRARTAIAVTYADSFPAIHGSHSPWRYTLISGVIPALPLILIRPFLPESPAWQQKKAAGTLKRPSLAALFTPELRRTTIVTTIMFACAYGAAFGAHSADAAHRPGLARSAHAAAAAAAADREPGAGVSGGRRAGRTLRARVSRDPHRVAPAAAAHLPDARPDHRAVRLRYRRHDEPGAGASGACSSPGFFTVAQMSFWGNYLPRVYPTHLRGTGEGFAANIGGRMLGTGFAFRHDAARRT